MTEQEIFLSALAIKDVAQRQAHLHRACGNDLQLLARVESSLSLNDSEIQFVKVPVIVPTVDDSDVALAATLQLQKDSTEDQKFPKTEAASGGKNRNAKPDDGSDGTPLFFLEQTDTPGSLGRLAHYDVREVLGRGAFGIVLKAFDQKLRRVVAIKVLAPEMALTSPARQRFLREARASAAIRHEHVVAIYAVEEEPLPYLVMEYIPGKTLERRLKDMGPLNVMTVVRFGKQIAEGLAAAHAQDLIHRDIKPGNILLELGAIERVKITDFGLARAADDASMTQSGLIAGTPMYMAPEQAYGQKLDQRADLFSLGSVLYQMVSGRPPFRAASTLAVLKRVTEDTPRPITEIIPETPHWLCDIITRLLEKQPQDRYQSAHEVADVLADCEAQLKANEKLHDFSRIPKAKSPSDSGHWRRIAAVLVLPIAALTLTEISGVTRLFRQRVPASDSVLRGGHQSPDPVTTIVSENADSVIAPISGQDVTESQTPTDAPGTPQVAVAPFIDSDVQRIAALPAAEQVEAVRQELMRRNPGFDGQLMPKIENNLVTELKLFTDEVVDISPVQAFQGLVALTCSPSQGPGRKGKLADISPLRGLPLARLDLTSTQVTSIEVVKEMPLTHLNLDRAPVDDLSPLAGKTLKLLHFGGTKVNSLSDVPIARLDVLQCYLPQIPDKAALQRLGVRYVDLWAVPATVDPERLRALTPPLSRVNMKPVEEFLKELAATKAGPAPFTDADVQRIAALSATQQVEEVRNELKRLNPSFDGKLTPTIENEVVTKLSFNSNDVSNIAPVRALQGLTFLYCGGIGKEKGKVSDLSPLQGMKLNKLDIQSNVVEDLSPLKGLPLTWLCLFSSNVRNLESLRSMQLDHLDLRHTPVQDLAPLKGMPLTSLWLGNCRNLLDLEPLKDLKLSFLVLYGCVQIHDLELCKEMPLIQVEIYDSGITDLEPLRGKELEMIRLTPSKISSGLDILREMKSLKRIGVSVSGDKT